MAYMIVKHLVMGWTRRVMASACTDFFVSFGLEVVDVLVCATQQRGGGKCHLVLVGIDCTMGRYHV